MRVVADGESRATSADNYLSKMSLRERKDRLFLSVHREVLLYLAASGYETSEAMMLMMSVRV